MTINIRMHHKEVQKLSPTILVIGVGGAGGNAVNNMIGAGLDKVGFLVCNTDAQALERSFCESKVQLGSVLTGGLGAGAKPEVGREAAEESMEDVLQYLDGANMVFVTAGMGGGTGTGAAPVIAKAAREKGILTVGVVTKPFRFEGSYRMKMAEAGIEQMQDYVDTLIVIPNQNLFRIANEKTTFAEAFRMADSVLQSAVRGVTDLMVRPGDVNLDFADIRSVMLEMGKAMMGTGEATGEDRAERAAEAAINNPLLDDVSMKGARGVIINVTGGSDMTLFEVDQACNRISSEVDPNANIIFGSSFDESMDGVLRVSVVATGIDAVDEKVRKNGGTRNWNGATPERRLERVPSGAEPAAQRQPEPAQTAAYYTQPAAVSSYTSVTPPMQSFVARAGAVTAPAATVSGAPSMTARRLEPDADMFSRDLAMGEFAGKKAETASAPAGGALRGSVVNSAFIPPQPIEVERQRAEAGFISPYNAPVPSRHHEQNESAYAMPPLPEPQSSQPAVQTFAAQPVAVKQETLSAPVSTPGFLRPPVSGAPAAPAPKRRATSLLDRITNTLRHHDEPAEVKSIRESTAQLSGQPQVQPPQDAPPIVPARAEQGGNFHSGLRASSRPEQQGNLAIDAPSIKIDQSIDDELDIPAFLRRQAN